MARVTVTPTAVTGKWPTALVTITETAADTSDLNRVALTGREIVIARNTGASTRTVTITSVADPLDNRTGHISTQNILAGKLMMVGPLDLSGWRQTDGYLYLQASHAEVVFSVIQTAG